MLLKVISGGQCGADIAGLRAARACHLLTGGYMPEGWKTKNGPLGPKLVKLYELKETPGVTSYPLRTSLNVMNSDATIRFAYNWFSPGERLTSKYCNQHNKAHSDITITRENGGFAIHHEQNRVTQIVEWIERNDIETLNVAGNADVAIELVVSNFLCQVFKQLEVNAKWPPKAQEPRLF